jgi:hypothetical protein
VKEAETIKAFLGLVTPGFTVEGDLPAVQLAGVELRTDGRVVAMVETDGRTLPIRFSFDEGKIARVEVL